LPGRQEATGSNPVFSTLREDLDKTKFFPFFVLLEGLLSAQIRAKASFNFVVRYDFFSKIIFSENI